MKDITGWISGNPYVRVTGLSEWTALSVTDAEAQGSDLSGEGDVAFADSDMWTTVSCDTGAVTLKTTVRMRPVSLWWIWGRTTPPPP